MVGPRPRQQAGPWPAGSGGWSWGTFQASVPFEGAHLQAEIPWEEVQVQEPKLTSPFLTAQPADKNTCLKLMNMGHNCILHNQ